MGLESETVYQYQPGGSLPPEALTYVVRQADNDLYNALLAGDYCYVLNSRQVGKSSLRVRTMVKLQAQGIACAEIELTGIGSQQITAAQWYGGVIQELISGFGLRVNRRNWLRERDDLSPIQCLGEFIEQVLLIQITQSLVIFIDEIDSVLGLSFPTDEFFALIRNCYEKRSHQTDYRRLTFAMLGVATPSDLIQNKYSTPFNIGRAIELKGFQLQESANLAQGLVGKASDSIAVLKEILHWTNGQPFLTQKLCWLVVTSDAYIAAGEEAQEIEKLVRSRLIENWESQDEPEHLRTIRDRLCRYGERNPLSRNNHLRERLLRLYQQILRKGKISARNRPEYLELWLSGLVVKQQGTFKVYNPIYQSVFNLNWVANELNTLYLNTNRLPAWSVFMTSLVVTVLLIGVRSLGLLQTAELQAFDQLMQLRPNEGPDRRLVLVTITEADVQSQPATEREGASLSDRSLTRLLAKLEQAHPRAIGLDLYRDRPVGKNYKDLVIRMRQNNRLFAICHYGNPGVFPPPEVPAERQGFNNVLLDPDNILRRHLLAVSSPSPCQSTFSFSWQLAQQYLKDEGIRSNITPDGYLQLGKTSFKPLENNTGAYHNLNASGHQILLNYRASRHIAKTMTLGEILGERSNLEFVKNRLVLIGTTAPSFNDHRWLTPYSRERESTQTISGVEIQAQMVSQLLSAVLEDRPLIRGLPKSIDFFVILGWSLVGGMIVWRFRSPFWVVLSAGIATSVLYGSCLTLLTLMGWWGPLVPSVLALMATGGSLLILYRTIFFKRIG
jgi:CHASE2 domain-containing sensor protein